MRDDKPHQIRRTGISPTDRFESSPEIEHYNNYSMSGILINGIDNNKNNTVAQSNEMLVIDVRMGETYENYHARFMNRYPKDENNEWEIIRVHYNDDGIAVTTHKRPPAHLQNIIIYNGPLEVRYEMYIESVSYNADGVRTGFTSLSRGLVNPGKKAQDTQLHRTEMDRINAIASQGVKDYIDGKIDAAEVTRIIENMYDDLVSLSIALGNTDGNDPKINAEILSAAQRMFINHALNGTIQANNEEGRAIAESKGLTHINDSFVYYNAKFFHANKELQEIGMVALTQIAENEGLDSFNVQDYFKWHHANICFNVAWNSGGVMKDVTAEPPKDFIMFYAPRLYSYNDYDDWYGNKDSQVITINDITRTDGHGGWDIYLTVPRGWQLFKSLPLWMTQGTFTNDDGNSVVTWDITQHINFTGGNDMQSRLIEFFAKYINNPLHGELTVWSDARESVHNVPFCSFSEKRTIQGNELTAAAEQNSFISNFQFRAMF
jgi:hypothetical protein